MAGVRPLFLSQHEIAPHLLHWEGVFVRQAWQMGADISPADTKVHPARMRDAVGLGRCAAPGRNIGLKVTIEQVDKGFAGEGLSRTGHCLRGLHGPISRDRYAILEYGLCHRRGNTAVKAGLQRNKPGFHDRHETPDNALFWYDLVALLGYWDTLDVVPGTGFEPAQAFAH